MYITCVLYSYIHHYLTAWAVIRIRNSFQTLITGQASYSNSTSLLIQVSISSSQIQCLFYFEHPWSLTCGDFSFCNSGSHLLSHIVSNIVSSAAQVLTIVFGMRTGVSPERIATGKLWALSEALSRLVRKLFFAACCNRTSSVSVSWLFSFHKEVRFTKFDLRSRLISLSSFELSSH